MKAPDPALVEAWLAARSLSRGLPLPVHDQGGLRVDSGQPEERRRYLFATPQPGLHALGEAIDEPFMPLKLCRPAGELMALLPPRWRLAHDHFMMTWEDPVAALTVPTGYVATLADEGGVTVATIADGSGDPAASGRAVEHDGVFIFDQIRTEEAHRRRGLGSAVMGLLLSARRSPTSRAVLTATDAGRALYLKLGWRDYCPYATALIPPAVQAG